MSKAVDPAAAPLFTPWVFPIGHLMYGVATGLGMPQSSAQRHATVSKHSRDGGDGGRV